MSSFASKVPWWHGQQSIIAQGCLTNSKHPKANIYGVTPTHIVRVDRNSSVVYDENGKRYIDYICGLGTNLFGYANETINRAVIEATAMGYSHSLPTHYEVVTGEKLKEVFPWIERVKWVKTGTLACQVALKIARKATGRDLILSSGYHGDTEEFCRCYNRELPNQIQELAPNLGNLSSDVAAVIVEPIVTDWSEARQAWLHELMTQCRKRGILVIFDEIITGFRWPKHSVSHWLNVRPDLICLGQAMANGLPLAAVCGSKELMDRPDYFASSTYGGEVLSLAAARAAMTLLLSKKMDIDRLWQQGTSFYQRFNEMAKGVVSLVGYPTRGVFTGHDLGVALFRQEAAKAGLLFGPSFFFNFPHTEPAIQDQTFAGLAGVFKRIRDSHVNLEGAMPAAPLAVKVRQ